MSDKIFLHLLILCAIWSQGNFGTFADEETNESPYFLLRQKRVISYLPGEDTVGTIITAPHIVAIQHDIHILCVGNILSNYVAITAAMCVDGNPSEYLVNSHAPVPEQGSIHYVRDIRLRYRDRAKYHGVGLVVVDPPFVYSAYCQNIPLHSEHLPPGTLGTFSGWGYLNEMGENRGTIHPLALRTIEVPIIEYRDCVNTYGPLIKISKRDICTFHPQRHSGHTDFGAGLVVDDQLVGILIMNGMVEGQNDPDYPDVFVNLQSSYYSQWITTNVALAEF